MNDDAFQLTQAILRKELSARESVALALQAVDTGHSKIQAIVRVDAGQAFEAAEEIDRRLSRGDVVGKLAGVPVVVKDNMCDIAGATTCGSNILRHYRSPYDAHVVSRLRSADAVIIGKSNLDEFAMGSSTENSIFGETRNPWDTSRVAGGSSGGSAAAVSAGMVPLALGSDTGGSIRQPAAFTGVVGLKPTYGRVSRYGLVAFGSSLDQIGPMTHTAQDAALVLSVISGRDERDSTSVDAPVPSFESELDKPLKGLKIGVAAEYFGEGLADDVHRAVRSALNLLRDNGAELIEVHLPHLKYAIACYYVIATAEASSNLARFDGVRYGHRTAEPEGLLDLYAATRNEGFGYEVKRRIMLGTYVLSSGYYDAYYVTALKVRTLIRRDFETAFEKVDLIASPVTPTTAFQLGKKSTDPLTMYLQDVYTVSANLAGIPAMSLPCGFDSARLPIGLQLQAPWFAEGVMLAVAHQFQQRTDFHTPRPPP